MDDHLFFLEKELGDNINMYQSICEDEDPALGASIQRSLGKHLEDVKHLQDALQNMLNVLGISIDSTQKGAQTDPPGCD